jgi:imidazolonepropionase-like amidohydrolase
VHPSPGETIENATVVFKDGVIVSVASGGQAPAGARVWDYTGKHIYAGFVDPYAPVEAPRIDIATPGAHFSPQVMTQRTALDGDGLSDSDREAFRKSGFVAAAIAPEDGILRGQAAVVSLRNEQELASGGGGGGGFGGFGGGNNQRRETPEPFDASVIKSPVYQAISLRGLGWGDGYPTSAQGAIALVRQTMLDADWYDVSTRVYTANPNSTEPPQRNDALAALGPNTSEGTPLAFVTPNENHVFWGARILNEFGRQGIVIGSGTEFRRLDAVAATGLPIVVPVNYPDAPSVKTRAQAEQVELRELMTWEQAPTNARRLVSAGVQISFTSNGLKNKGDFLSNVRKAVQYGLSEDAALAALTTNAAQILGVSDRLGAVRQGYLASVVVTDGPLFDKESKISDVWVDGFRYEVTAPEGPDMTGSWAMNTGDDHKLVIAKGASVSVKSGDDEAKATDVKIDGDRITFLLDTKEIAGHEGVWQLDGLLEEDTIFGRAVQPDGTTMAWSATRIIDEEADDDADEDKAEGEGDGEKKMADAEKDPTADIPEKLPTPFGAFGYFEQPTQETVAVVGATIWTEGPQGIIENGTMIVQNGKITYVGPAGGANTPNGARVIDAKGKHVTPGIIDAHSHTGIGDTFGDVNEGGQAVTAEARVQDIINADDISWYRELAGGLTAANQLHGSANPIGGQNSVVKARWGVTHPDEMRIEGAPAGIKFALGENPKRSENRYPDTRMGVEVIIRDRFDAAQDYMAEWERYEALPKREKDRTLPPRRDLELDTIVEIINGDRLVHSHSYRQDEILMLCRVADDYNFKIGTFQHVLEGYKVAEAVKNSAIGASMFSDWWAYKFEVYDAIPYNGSIMHDVGVPVTFNSDSNELARHLNTEATKAVKYGGVEPAEALKFVTYNAALQFGIEDKVGSLEKGKDADFVVWNGDPLATTSRPDSTFVDGRELFSIEKDAELRAWAAAERSRILQKLYASKDAGGAKGGMMRRGRPALFGENLDADERAAYEAYILETFRSGMNPEYDHIAECGLLNVHNH